MPGQQLIMHELLILLAEIKFSYFLKKLSYYENLCIIQYNYCRFYKDYEGRSISNAPDPFSTAGN